MLTTWLLSRSEFGTSTQVLLNYLRKIGGHLHAIDPYPDFDVEQFQRDNQGLLTFYRQPSLEALKHLPKVDLALVDGIGLKTVEQNRAKMTVAMPAKDKK